MHNYSVDNRFTTKTKVGNWYEESQLQEYEFKEYLHQKDNNGNITLKTASKLQFSAKPVKLSVSKDGYLHTGDMLQLFSCNAESILSFNLHECILNQDTYAVTTSRNILPALRNCFQIQLVTETNANIKYGDKVRFVARIGQETSIDQQKHETVEQIPETVQQLYLQSVSLSPMRSSKLSRCQQVSVTRIASANSLWIIEHVDAKQRFDSVGKEVRVSDNVLVKHALTAQWLASDLVQYPNEFGIEYEVFCKSVLSNNKTQNLFAEKQGHKSVLNPLRSQSLLNEWTFIIGS